MDIVSRLKMFMDSIGIANSQFADNCGIPRPTISQILNGRNKKISDELISKIHSTFPDLSILWLMFGEGDMRTAKNIAISEPQNEEKLSFSNIDSIDTHEVNTEGDLFAGVRENGSEKSGAEVLTEKDFEIPPEVGKTPFESGKPSTEASNLPDEVNARIKSSSSGKKITSIVVFYDDNTFLTFNPSV